MKLIYSDANSLAYEKSGARFSLMHHAGRVLITEMRDGKVDEYMMDIDDALRCLTGAPDGEFAVKFIRKLKRKMAKAQLWLSVKILFKITGHMIIAALFGGLAVFLYFTLRADG